MENNTPIYYTFYYFYYICFFRGLNVSNKIMELGRCNYTSYIPGSYVPDYTTEHYFPFTTLLPVFFVISPNCK